MTLSVIAPTFATCPIFIGCDEFVTCLKNDLYSTKGGVSEVQGFVAPVSRGGCEPARGFVGLQQVLDHGDGMPSV